MNFVISNWRSV